jgi:undecaprenyl diphosphate synthase
LKVVQDIASSHPERSSIPRHVAIILDGNGRWATQQGLPRIEGHYVGTENIHRVTKAFAEYKVKYLTIYAFSSENWKRPEEEVKGLLQIMSEVIDRETKALHEKGVRLRHLGRFDRLPQELQQKVEKAIELTKDNTRMTLSIAFDYGSRAEILDAMKRIMKDGHSPQVVDESMFSNYLYTAGLPDPDLIIRTGGELRLSNFLLWQSAYSEFYFTPVLWPKFDEEEVKKALISYSNRERRFGGLEL